MNSNYLLNAFGSYNLNIPTDIARVPISENFLLQSQSLLNRVFKFIETNYQQSISLREVAKAVGRSPAYLTDLVRRETGKTVLRWIIEHRMAEARRLLLETNHSVEQIAEAVGYFDRRHFSRLFLRFHNITPNEWRKRHQSKSIPLWQTDVYKASSSKLMDQKVKNITDAEAQKLQACCEEIAAILNKNCAIGETMILEGKNSSIAKTDDGSIYITLASSSKLH
ncbi:hypothetical protein NUACC21_48860 [Scytonema sp. NUACC21]